jgi:hypothetical protein
VLERVRQTFLDDPVRGEVDRGRERDGIAVDVEAYRQPGSCYVVHERVEPVEPRLRRELDAVAVAAHSSQHAPHLCEGGAPRAFDTAERVSVFFQRVWELVPHCADLQDHHADGVRDDVVELARNACALLGHGDPSRRLSFALGEDRPHLRRLSVPLGEGRAHLRRLGLLGTLAQGVARDPRDHEPEWNEDEVAGRL